MSEPAAESLPGLLRGGVLWEFPEGSPAEVPRKSGGKSGGKSGWLAGWADEMFPPISKRQPPPNPYLPLVPPSPRIPPPCLTQVDFSEHL